MLTWSDLQTRYQDMTDDSTANLTFGKSMMNAAHQKLARAGGFHIGEIEVNITSIADDHDYALSPRIGKVKTVVFVDASSNEWPMVEVKNLETWNRLRSNSTGNASRPTHFFPVYALRELWVWPEPDAATYTFRVTAQRNVPILENDDYTTGTGTFTNDDATVAGSGTTYAATHVGRFIQGGDGYFYEIASFTSATSIELTLPFEGVTEASVATKIGEIPVIPEEHQDAICHYAVGMYEGQKKDGGNTAFWLGLYEKVKDEMTKEAKNRTTSQVFRDEDDEYRHINDYPSEVS